MVQLLDHSALFHACDVRDKVVVILVLPPWKFIMLF